MALKYQTGILFKMLAKQNTHLKSQVAYIDAQLAQIFKDAPALQKQHKAKGFVFMNNAQDSFSFTLCVIKQDNEVLPLYDAYKLDFNDGSGYGLENDYFEIAEHPVEDLFYLLKSEQLNAMLYIWLQEAVWRSGLAELPALLLYCTDEELSTFTDLRDGTPEIDDFALLEEKYKDIVQVFPDNDEIAEDPAEQEVVTSESNKYYVATISLKTMLYGFEPGYGWDSPTSQTSLSRWEFPEHEPIFSKLVFQNKNSKMVDFLSSSNMGGSGMVISERVKNLFEGFELMPHRLYRLPEHEHKGTTHQYYLLQLVTDYNDFSMIDFDKSSFYSDIWDDNMEWGNNIVDINATNAKEFSTALSEGNIDGFSRMLFYEKLTLKRQPPDIFAIREVECSEYIFSNRLKQALEKMKATGLEDFEEIEIEWVAS